MIAKFWDALFEYGDMLREQGREDDHKVIEDVDAILQRAYDNGLANARVIKGKVPVDRVEELILTIPDIVVYYDETDDSYFYDLDGHHFDHQDEVVKYLIDTRKSLQCEAMNKVKKELLEYVVDRLHSIKTNEVVGKKSPKTVVEVGEKKSGKRKILTEEFLRKAYVEEGKSIKEISVEVGVHNSTVKKYLDMYCIPVRKVGRR